jgi:ubiquinone/menaquinone biosynthesis C-methylase UbiE
VFLNLLEGADVAAPDAGPTPGVVRADQCPPPYFDVLFDRLRGGDEQVRAAFGRHVHWGYWPDPTGADLSPEGYGRAAEALCREVCDLAATGDGQHVLDVGCGLGGTVASLNERFTGLKLTGLNIDARQLDYAREHVTPRPPNDIAWVEGDACRLPFEAPRFDVVLAVECVFHFDRQLFFAEASRVLRPGGRLALSDFCLAPRAVEYLSAANLFDDEAIVASYGRIDLRWSANEYRGLAQATGFRLVESRDITSHTLPTYDFLLHSIPPSPDARRNELFTRATNLLAKASRKGLVQYTILALQKLESATMNEPPPVGGN